MKRISLALFALLALSALTFMMTSCSAEESPQGTAGHWVGPNTIQWNGEYYYWFGGYAEEPPSNDDIIGEVTSISSQTMPTQDGEVNFPAASVGAPVAWCGDGLAVWLDYVENWAYFEPADQ